MVVRGIRGAIQVEKNIRSSIHRATRELLTEIVRLNRITPPQIAAAFFTLTEDLNADFPAYAARDMGWSEVPMLCNREVPVPGSMPKVVRVLLLVNYRSSSAKIRHVYLGKARWLRPDLALSARARLRKRQPSR